MNASKLSSNGMWKTRSRLFMAWWKKPDNWIIDWPLYLYMRLRGCIGGVRKNPPMYHDSFFNLAYICFDVWKWTTATSKEIWLRFSVNNSTFGNKYTSCSSVVSLKKRKEKSSCYHGNQRWLKSSGLQLQEKLEIHFILERHKLSAESSQTWRGTDDEAISVSFQDVSSLSIMSASLGCISLLFQPFLCTPSQWTLGVFVMLLLHGDDF